MPLLTNGGEQSICVARISDFWFGAVQYRALKFLHETNPLRIKL
jgi:hypothetical protein